MKKTIMPLAFKVSNAGRNPNLGSAFADLGLNIASIASAMHGKKKAKKAAVEKGKKDLRRTRLVEAWKSGTHGFMSK